MRNPLRDRVLVVIRWAIQLGNIGENSLAGE